MEHIFIFGWNNETVYLPENNWSKIFILLKITLLPQTFDLMGGTLELCRKYFMRNYRTCRNIREQIIIKPCSGENLWKYYVSWCLFKILIFCQSFGACFNYGCRGNLRCNETTRNFPLQLQNWIHNCISKCLNSEIVSVLYKFQKMIAFWFHTWRSIN